MRLKRKMKEDLQNKYMEYQILVNNLKQLEQQFVMMEQHLNDLKGLDESLDSLINTKENEMFSAVGNGVFVKTELKDKDSVLVNIGAGVVVRKKIKDAKNLVIRQVDEVQNLVIQIQDDFNNLNNEISILKEELHHASHSA